MIVCGIRKCKRCFKAAHQAGIKINELEFLPFSDQVIGSQRIGDLIDLHLGRPSRELSVSGIIIIRKSAAGSAAMIPQNDAVFLCRGISDTPVDEFLQVFRIRGVHQFSAGNRICTIRQPDHFASEIGIRRIGTVNLPDISGFRRDSHRNLSFPFRNGIFRIHMPTIGSAGQYQNAYFFVLAVTGIQNLHQVMGRICHFPFQIRSADIQKNCVFCFFRCFFFQLFFRLRNFFQLFRQFLRSFFCLFRQLRGFFRFFRCRFFCFFCCFGCFFRKRRC